MNATELSVTETKTALSAAFTGTTKVKLRGAEFLECLSNGANKFIGILTLEFYHPKTGRRAMGVLRVYGPRQSLRPYVESYDNGDPVSLNMEQLVPGIAPLEATPLRIGGMAICNCSIGERADVAYDIVSPYGQKYINEKNLKGYRLPSFQLGGKTGGFFISAEETYPLYPTTADVKWTIPGPASSTVADHPIAVMNNAIADYANPDTIFVKHKIKPDAKAKHLAQMEKLATNLPPMIVPPPRLTDSGNMFSSPRKRINIAKPN